MAGAVRQPSAQPSLRCNPRVWVTGPSLQPRVVEKRAAPVGEQADAVRTGENAVKVVVHRGAREVGVDDLPDFECGHEVQGQADDDAEGAERDHGSAEPAAR